MSDAPHQPLFPPKHLLVPVDLGEEERVATELLVDAAASLARALGARVTLVHVAPPIATAMAPLSPPPPGYPQLLEVITATRTAQRATLSALGTRTASGGAVEVDAVLLERDGRAADAIVALAAASAVDLILVTSHGRHGLSKVFLGSVAERLVGLSMVPVLIIPHRAHPTLS